MKGKQLWAVLCAALALTAVLTACRKQTPAQAEKPSDYSASETGGVQSADRVDGGKDMADDAKDQMDNIGDTAKDAADDVVNGAENVIGDAADGVKDAADGVGDAAKDIMDGARRATHS